MKISQRSRDLATKIVEEILGEYDRIEIKKDGQPHLGWSREPLIFAIASVIDKASLGHGETEVLKRIMIEMRSARTCHSEHREAHALARNFDGAARESHKEEAVRKLLQTIEQILDA
jgi:hypothetical protein